ELAVLADIAEPMAADGILDRADAHRPTVDGDVAAGDLVPADQGTGPFGAAGADETIKPENFALAQAEADVTVAEGSGEVAGLEYHGVAGNLAMAGDDGAVLAADHGLDEVAAGHALHAGTREGGLAVAQHGYAIAEGEDFLE